MLERPTSAATTAASCRAGSLIVFVEDFAEFFLEFAIGQHFLELAPGSLAFLALGANPSINAGEQTVVIGAVFRLDNEFIVYVEVLVIAFHHRFLL
jgi:hypothetical protein